MPKHRHAAFVLVSQAWWAAAAPLLAPSPDGFQAPLVRLLGPFVSQDAAGVWLGEVPANLTQSKRGAQVMMSLLIPWQEIVAMGLIEESTGVKPGFAALPVEAVAEPLR